MKNRDHSKSKSYNCYNYATNNYEIKYCQPGERSKLTLDNNTKYFCESLISMVEIDGYKKVNCKDSCQNGYKIMSFTGEGDYHFFRRHENGFWSHKPGTYPATMKDSNEDPIKDPLILMKNQLLYTNMKLCSCFCVNNND